VQGCHHIIQGDYVAGVFSAQRFVHFFQMCLRGECAKRFFSFSSFSACRPETHYHPKILFVTFFIGVPKNNQGNIQKSFLLPF
jgi:hypothetical protein